MNRERVFVSSIGSDAYAAAAEFGLGMEIAHYCDSTALDDGLGELKKQVVNDIGDIKNLTLHAPFSELFPCAIDPQIREVARRRYIQSLELAKEHGAKKVVIHAGLNPYIYYPIWFEEKSIDFWKSFAECIPEGMTICLENVLETDPELLVKIVKAVDDKRIQICLDIGHANAYSEVPVRKWIETCAPFLSHLHIHNNDGKRDLHQALTDGVMDIKELISLVEELSPEATYTLELLEAGPSVRWLAEEGMI